MKVVLNAEEYEKYKANVEQRFEAEIDDVVRETVAINAAIKVEQYIGVTAKDRFEAAHPTPGSK